MTQIATVHLVILALFSLGTTMLMMVTASNALRLRNVEISWKSGKLLGYPLFSTVFLMATIGLTCFIYVQQMSQLTVTIMCYNWIGATWFISSYLMSKRYVTDHGLVKNINDPSQTVAWNRIMDYVERNQGKEKKYVFFYPECRPDGKSQNIRLELDVPADKILPFGHLVQKKLGYRFSLGKPEFTGIEELK